MEKECLEININGKNQDVVINYCMDAIKNENAENGFIQNENGTFKTSGNIFNVVAYVRDKSDVSKVAAVHFTPFAIKKLYAHIIEIEAKEGERENVFD